MLCVHTGIADLYSLTKMHVRLALWDCTSWHETTYAVIDLQPGPAVCQADRQSTPENH